MLSALVRTVESIRIEEDRGGFVKRHGVFEQVGFSLRSILM